MRSKIEQQLSLDLSEAECAGGSYSVNGNLCLDLAWVKASSGERMSGALIFENASAITVGRVKIERIHALPELAKLLEVNWSDPGTCRLVFEMVQYEPRRTTSFDYFVHCDGIAFVRGGITVARANSPAQDG